MDNGILDDAPAGRKAAALELAERGFHVLAVQRNDKVPDPLLAPHSFEDATRDSEVVGGWFDVKPRANLGIACGADYGLVVFDIDVKNNSPGMKTYAELGLGGYVTLTARTPSGGFHQYFRHPNVVLKATLPGIDVKGASGAGYVVAPPSTLPNGAYTWLDPEVPIADMPAELVDALAVESKKPASKPKGASPVDDLKTPQGQRHAKLVELAGVYRGKNLDATEIEVLLWHAAEHYFDPPFSRDDPREVREIEDMAFWISKKPAGDGADTPLVPLSTAELVARAAEKPPRCVLEPILPEAGNLMVHGASGIGKSHIGLSIALAIATGRPLLEWTVPEAQPVLFIDGEMPLNELTARLAAYLHGAPAPTTLFWLAARAIDGDLPDLADRAGQDVYLAAIQSCGAKVVVFDNLSCLRLTSTEAPENSVESWQPIGAFIRRLNGLGVAVIVIHHSAKSGSQRGSSAHVAVFDTVLAVKAPGEGQADPLAENDVELVFEKHRRFGGEAARSFRAKAIGDPDGFCTWISAGVDPLMEDVIRLHRSGHSLRDMAQITKRSKAGIEKAILRAKAAGKWPLGESL